LNRDGKIYMDLEGWSSRLKVFADATRVRLLALLQDEELTVAELSAITQLAQPRVSTHLARLKEAGLVRDRRSGVSAYYRFDDAALDPAQRALWQSISTGSDDPLLRQDAERVPGVLATRAADQSWADSVAGDMERHYSPGRTWEATARALTGLVELGDVLDIACGDGVLAELLAEHARSITGVDVSATLVGAARARLKGYPHVTLIEGDMHALPLGAAGFDHVFLMHALAYTRRPLDVLREAARVLRPGGKLVVAALNAHPHKATMQSYDHVNLGIAPPALRKLLEQAGLAVDQCRVTSREDRPPYFEVVTALARKPH